MPLSESSRQGVCFVGASIFDPVNNAVGGAERQVRLLGQHLAEQGWDVRYTAVTALAGKTDPGGMPGVLTLFAGDARRKRWGWMLSALGALLRVPEPVLYQRGASGLTAAAWLAARLIGKRFVWAAASDADLSFERSLARAAGRGRGSALKRAWAWPLERLIDSAIRGADLVLYQHEGQRAELTTGRRVRAERLHLLRNVVELSAESPLPGSERTTVAWVGSIRPGKRPERFVELAETSRALSYRFVMAGRIYPPCTTELFGETPEARNVTYAGELPHDEVVALVRSARVLVSTSEVEGFPNTWLEAWAQGTPVLSLDLDPGGVIAAHGTGWLAHSQAELHAAAALACSDATEWARASEAARAYVAAEHAPDVIGARLVELLCELAPHRTR